jgi:hypothetical protein
MKIFICLCLALNFSNVMANTRVGTGGISNGGSESGGRNIHGGEGGEGGKITGGDSSGRGGPGLIHRGTNGGKTTSGDDSGGRSLVRSTLGGGEGGDD